MSAVIRPGTATDTTADPRWRPFRVDARLTDPMVSSSDPMHLDGPLAWCAYLAAREAGLILPPMSPDRCTDLALPLATWTAPAPPGAHPAALAADPGQVWGWACSRARVEAAGSTAVDIRKRPPIEEHARFGTDRRYHAGLGPHKARNITHPGRLVTGITWWALGDPDAAAGLLTRLRGLGRVTGHGNGRVHSITVTPGGPADRDRWRMRDWPAPAGGLPGALRAPYHHPTRRVPISAEVG